MRPAGATIRLVAGAIDLAIVALLAHAAWFCVYWLAPVLSGPDYRSDGLEGVGVLVVLPFATWLVLAGFESSPLQGTIGKVITRIQVVGDEGQRIGFAAASIRYWVKALLMALAYIGAIGRVGAPSVLLNATDWAFLYESLFFISIIGPAGVPIAALIALSRTKRGPHDRAGRTRVVYRGRKGQNDRVPSAARGH